MVIRNEQITKVHLSEIAVLIVESTAVSLTTMLLCELARRKIRVIFCDETHNPYGELEPYYGCHDSAGKLRGQMNWTQVGKQLIWTELVREKIRNQAKVLERYDLQRSKMLQSYADEIQMNDSSNREGHAAKVYFNTLFGEEFSRRKDCIVNSCLNYGYSILLSAVNREIAALGYSTQIGIFHDNMFNNFNLGSDIMEPIRPLVDCMVLDMNPDKFDTEIKHKLASLLNLKVMLSGRNQYLINALPTYVKSVTDSIESEDPAKIIFCEYENKSDAFDCVL